MDVHAEYEADFVRSCVRVLERTGADNVGGPAQARAQGRSSSDASRRRSAARSASAGRSTARRATRAGSRACGPGAFRREVFERVGLFDPHAVTNEDAELNQRIADAGGRVYLSPEIGVAYYPRESMRALARQYFKYGQGQGAHAR